MLSIRSFFCFHHIHGLRCRGKSMAAFVIACRQLNVSGSNTEIYRPAALRERADYRGAAKSLRDCSGASRKQITETGGTAGIARHPRSCGNRVSCRRERLSEVWAFAVLPHGETPLPPLQPLAPR
jgi:hypothetical protein